MEATKLKAIFATKKITIPRIAILGMLLALIIGLKYAFGFVLGIELVSFMFVFLGIFLPVIDILLLVACFNLLILVIYGFGGWWMMYWVIWPMDALVSKLLSKFTKNRYVFAGWGFIAGASVFFWYFISDMIFFGSSFAVINLITAIPVNTIEGLTTMIAIITIAPTMAKIFAMYQSRFWPGMKSWQFAKVKHPRINAAAMVLIVAIAITGIVLMFVYNQVFLDWKDSLIGQNGGKGDGGRRT